MNNIPYQFILFLIVFVILAIIFISSVYYSNDEDTTVKTLSKSAIKNKSVNQISFIKPEINNNCYILNISSAKENIGYSLSGIFTNSCISVYKNGERVTNYICDGSKNIVFSCNENILTYYLGNILKVHGKSLEELTTNSGVKLVNLQMLNDFKIPEVCSIPKIY